MASSSSGPGGKYCSCCNKLTTLMTDLSSKLIGLEPEPEVSLSVLDVLELVIGCKQLMEPALASQDERSYACVKCVQTLRTAYKSLMDVKNQIAPDSLIGQRLVTAMAKLNESECDPTAADNNTDAELVPVPAFRIFPISVCTSTSTVAAAKKPEGDLNSNLIDQGQEAMIVDVDPVHMVVQEIEIVDLDDEDEELLDLDQDGPATATKNISKGTVAVAVSGSGSHPATAKPKPVRILPKPIQIRPIPERVLCQLMDLPIPIPKPKPVPATSVSVAVSVSASIPAKTKDKTKTTFTPMPKPKQLNSPSPSAGAEFSGSTLRNSARGSVAAKRRKLSDGKAQLPVPVINLLPSSEEPVAVAETSVEPEPVQVQVQASLPPAIPTPLTAAIAIAVPPKPSLSLYNGLCFTFLNLNVSNRWHKDPDSTSSSTATTPAVVAVPKIPNPKVANRKTHAVSLIGVFNRIPQVKDELFQPFTPPLASQLDSSTFLLTPEDFALIKNDHRLIIKKILVETVSVLEGIQVETESDKHAYTNESSKISKTINLGLLPDEDKTTKGLINILKHMSTYLPKGKNGVSHPLLAFGDGVTSDRVTLHAKWFNKKDGNLKSIVAGPSAWHKRVHLLLDDLRLLMKAPGPDGKGHSVGTMAYIKAKYLDGAHRGRFGLQPNSYQTSKLTKFTLYSYLTALAIQFILKEDLSRPANEVINELQALPMEEKSVVLDGLADKILAFEWHGHVEQSILSEVGKSCVCNDPSLIEYDFETNPKSWIICSSLECKKRCWYHKPCLQQHIDSCSDLKSPFKNPPTPKQPPALLKKKTKAKATSRKSKSRSKKSKAKAKYPKRKPVKVKPIQSPATPAGPIPIPTISKWFCSDECAKRSQDSVLSYTKAIIFSGLNQESYHQAIRENDGTKMKTYNKLHLIQLHNRTHDTLFRIWHRTLAQIGGLSPPHIQHDLQWNTTVNITGQAGNNMEVDLYNEFVNRVWKKYFTYDIQTSPGREYLQRRSQLFDIDKMIKLELKVLNIQECKPSPNTEEYDKWMTDLNECIQTLLQHHVLIPNPSPDSGPRFHEGYENFKYDVLYLSDLDRYRQTVRSHCDALDNNTVPETVEELDFESANENVD